MAANLRLRRKDGYKSSVEAGLGKMNGLNGTVQDLHEMDESDKGPIGKDCNSKKSIPRTTL
jgi:hypothetical protein